MITSVHINNRKQFSDFFVSTNMLSSIYIRGYNFKTLTGVLLSSTRNSIFTNLTSINFSRQPSISGILIPFKSNGSNSMQLFLPYVDANSAEVEVIYVDIVPFNKAGYSSVGRTLRSIYMSGDTTYLKFHQSANKYMLVDELGNIFKTETGDTLISDNGNTITDNQGNIILNGNINIIQTP